jgi:hypothetical protein
VVETSLSQLNPRYAGAPHALIETAPASALRCSGVTVGNFMLLHRAAKAFRKVYPMIAEKARAKSARWLVDGSLMA